MKFKDVLTEEKVEFHTTSLIIDGKKTRVVTLVVPTGKKDYYLSYDGNHKFYNINGKKVESLPSVPSSKILEKTFDRLKTKLSSLLKLDQDSDEYKKIWWEIKDSLK